MPPVRFYTKTYPEKNPIIEENAWTKDVYNHAKKGQLILKTPGWLYSKYRCVNKSFTWKRSRLDLILQDLGLFFLVFFLRIYFPQDFLSCDLISWDFIDSPHTILGKTSQESKTQDFISSFPRNLENADIFPKFLFPGIKISTDCRI